ncbi:MAG: DUF2157 domain-containing protein [Candidatus Omnitrophota bacterium]
MAIRWLYRELPELITKGILTQETAERLRHYYGEVKSVGKRVAMLIILGTTGALLIGLGIILLLAHNWEEFSRFTRAVLSLLPLVIGQCLALWVLWKRPGSGAFKEGAATFLSLMVGASIALISQTYNIPGDAGTFILTWMLLIIPLTYLMQASMPAAIYLIGITAWSGTYWDNPLKAALFWPLAAITIPHFIWALRREIYVLRTSILSLIMIVCVSIATGFSLGKTWQGSWVIIFPSLYSIFYFLGWLKIGRITTNWQRPLRIVGAIALFTLAFQFTFRYVWQYLDKDYFGMDRNISDISAMPDHIITTAIVAMAMLLFYDNVKRKNWMVSLFGAVPLLAIIAYSIRGESTFLPLLLFNAYLFVLSVSRIIFGVRNNNLAIINTGMLMLAVLIIARFFDSDINFIMKGLAFIIVGAGFLATNLVLSRRMGGAK